MEERTAGPYLVSTFFMSVITVLDGIAHAPKQQGHAGHHRIRSAAKTAFWTLLIGFALAEATGLFGLLIALIILFG